MPRFKNGDKVTYKTPFKEERGIVKRYSIDPKYVFVVYNCGGDWDNFMDYTGASTSESALIKGWKE